MAYINMNVPATLAAWNFVDKEESGSGASTPLFVPFLPAEPMLPGDGAAFDHNGSSTPRVNTVMGNQGVAMVSQLQSKLKDLQRPGGDAAQKKLVLPPPGLDLPAAPVTPPTTKVKGTETKWQVSIGSVGHPFTCGSPCPFVMKNGECPDGAKCTMCHECPLQPSQRDAAGAAWQEGAPAEAPAAQSVGSLGHPYNCGNACKYVKRKSGCRNGSQCLDCHLCHWQRNPLQKPTPGAAPKPWPADVPMPSAAQQRPQPAQPQFVLQGAPCSVSANSAGRQSTLLTGSKTAGQQPVRPDVLDFAVGMFPAAPLAREEVQAEDLCPSVGSIGHPHTCGQACKYVRKHKGCKDGKLCVCCHLCVWRRYQPPAAPRPATEGAASAAWNGI